MFQSKRIFWQYELEGEFDLEKEVDRLIRDTADEYKQQAETTSKAIQQVEIDSRTCIPMKIHIKNLFSASNIGII